MATAMQMGTRPPGVQLRGASGVSGQDVLQDGLVDPLRAREAELHAPVHAGQAPVQMRAASGGPPQSRENSQQHRHDPADAMAARTLATIIEQEIARVLRAKPRADVSEMTKALRAAQGWPSNVIGENPGLAQALLDLARNTLSPKLRAQADMGNAEGAAHLLFSTLNTVLRPETLRQAGNDRVQTCIGTSGEYILAKADPTAYVSVISGLFQDAEARLPSGSTISVKDINADLDRDGPKMPANSKLFQSAVLDTFGPGLASQLVARARGQQLMLSDHPLPVMDGAYGTMQYVAALGLLKTGGVHRVSFSEEDLAGKGKKHEGRLSDEELLKRLPPMPFLCMANGHACVVSGLAEKSRLGQYIRVFDPAGGTGDTMPLRSFVQGYIGDHGAKLVPFSL